MNLRNFTLDHLIVILAVFLSFSSCTKEDICTKQVNVPIWNEKEQVFEDNFQDFPCDFDGIAKSLSEFTLKEKKEFRLNFKKENATEILEQSLNN